MILLSQANALYIPLANESVHCVVTSPPYWGLRDYGIEGQLGLEPTPEEYVDNLMRVFREVRRVLRDDGTCWVNFGDSYVAHPQQRKPTDKAGDKQATNVGSIGCPSRSVVDLKPLDLVGIPWRVAFALQADGWYLRSDVIWAKGVSFCDSYSGSVMPESVNGWRWERHRVKVVGGDRLHNPYQAGAGTKQGPGLASRAQREAYFENGEGAPKYADCPGCPKCEQNDGYVLRRGSWRPTKAHEYVFMLAKSERYFCDAEAVKEGKAEATITDMRTGADGHRRNRDLPANRPDRGGTNLGGPEGKRNPRTVWTINPQPYSGAHYACFPPALVEPCIKAGTSERGVCPVCGAPWARVVEKRFVPQDDVSVEKGIRSHNGQKPMDVSNGWQDVPRGTTAVTTQDWRPTCTHAAEPIPAIVLDPFVGSGTTMQEARRLGRRSVGLDLSGTYLTDNARERLELDKLAAWENGSENVEAALDGLPLFAGVIADA